MANLSQQKRERMIEFLKQLKELHNDDDSLIALNEIENEILSKKYGLVWEQHEEQVDIMMQDNVPVFSEVTEREIVGNLNSDKFNFLLEGDNLHSLKLLEKTHRGRIDVIYIDPPYNTGNKDFVYNDIFVKKEDSFKHSMWLSFMAVRLRLAYKLLKNDGLMFLSIDDNEVAPLTMLMNDIFGEDNFVISMPRITKKSGKTTTAYAKNHDYILVYTKQEKNIFLMEEHIDEAFSNEDEYVAERGKYKLNQTLDYDSLSYSASLDYPLEIEGETFYPGSSKEKWMDRQAGNHRRADWAWRWSKKLFDFAYENGFVVIKRKEDGSARIYTKTYLNAKLDKDSDGNPIIVYNKRTKATSSIEFVNNIYSNDNAKKDLDAFGLKDDFDYSKPVELIKKLLRAYYRKDAIVLDFFAGSCTTGQAVLELNVEDNGSRRFILCTNNQNNICEEISYVRLSKTIKEYVFDKELKENLYMHRLVMKDLKSPDALLEEVEEIKKANVDKYDSIKVAITDGVLEVLGITKLEKLVGIPANMKYYKTEFIPKTSKQDNYLVSEELLKHIKEMVQLENGVNLDGENYIILLTDEDADELEKEPAKIEKCKGIYISSDVFLTSSQEQLFAGIVMKQIPDYYFEDELREVHEIW